MAEHLVAALYKFVPVSDVQSLRDSLQKICDARGVQGILLVAPEGLNGTVAGSPDDVRSMLAELRRDERFADVEHKESYATSPPFKKLRVRIKPEIVTMGVPDVDPSCSAGTYVEPEDWNALISDPDVLLVDTRNDYEVGIGTFEGAVDANIWKFRDFPAWADRELLSGASDQKPRKIAMFCTGGIRCEKSTSYLRTKGFDEVYHLKGGILRYLETVPEDQSLWNGQCFVFDARVSVGHDLVPGDYRICGGCGHPIRDEPCTCGRGASRDLKPLSADGCHVE